MTNLLINTSCQFCKNDKTIPLHTITGMYDDPRKFNIVQCLVCSLIYINPRYSKQENLESYEEKYFTTNVVDPSGNNRCVINEKESKIKAHKIDCKHLKQYKTGGRILDFGSGLGFFLDALEGRWEKHAVDTSSFAINYIQNSAIHKFSGSLFKARYKDKYFDAIYIGNTLDRLVNLDETLTELERILKDDGVILVQTPNINSLCAKIFKDKYRLLYSNHLVSFSPNTLKMFFKRNGFDIISIKYPYFKTSLFSAINFVRSTGKIILKLLANTIGMNLQIVSPPYWGNVMSAIIVKNRT